MCLTKKFKANRVRWEIIRSRELVNTCGEHSTSTPPLVVRGPLNRPCLKRLFPFCSECDERAEIEIKSRLCGVSTAKDSVKCTWATRNVCATPQPHRKCFHTNNNPSSEGPLSCCWANPLSSHISVNLMRKLRTEISIMEPMSRKSIRALTKHEKSSHLNIQMRVAAAGSSTDALA